MGTELRKKIPVLSLFPLSFSQCALDSEGIDVRQEVLRTNKIRNTCSLRSPGKLNSPREWQGEEFPSPVFCLPRGAEAGMSPRSLGLAAQLLSERLRDGIQAPDLLAGAKHGDPRVLGSTQCPLEHCSWPSCHRWVDTQAGAGKQRWLALLWRARWLELLRGARAPGNTWFVSVEPGTCSNDTRGCFLIGYPLPLRSLPLNLPKGASGK